MIGTCDDAESECSGLILIVRLFAAHCNGPCEETLHLVHAGKPQTSHQGACRGLYMITIITSL